MVAAVSDNPLDNSLDNLIETFQATSGVLDYGSRDGHHVSLYARFQHPSSDRSG